MVDTDDTQRTKDDEQRTPWVWHKLPTGELKTSKFHRDLQPDWTMPNVKLFHAIFIYYHVLKF